HSSACRERESKSGERTSWTLGHNTHLGHLLIRTSLYIVSIVDNQGFVIPSRSRQRVSVSSGGVGYSSVQAERLPTGHKSAGWRWTQDALSNHSEEDSGVARGRSKEPEVSGDEGTVTGSSLGDIANRRGQDSAQPPFSVLCCLPSGVCGSCSRMICSSLRRIV